MDRPNRVNMGRGMAGCVAALGMLLVGAPPAAGRGESTEPIRIVVEPKELHKVDPRLFGQFMERPSWGETGPEAATDADGALSAEVVDMLRAMRIPIVRFPGGTDVDYVDWTDMISNAPGRAPERPVTTGHRGDKVTNRFGYDEYLRLGAELKWESILVVNFLDGLAKKKPLAEAARHAAGLVAYANAPVGARLPEGMPDWPALRAKNGHPEPYGVKIFQVGNEWWCGRFPQEVRKALRSGKADVLAPWFRDCIVAYADAMRAVDPGIELIVDGHMGFGGERLVLADPEVRKRVKYAAFHRYAFGSPGEVKRDGVRLAPGAMQPGEHWLALTAMPGRYDDDGNCRAFGDTLRFARGLGYEIAVTEWNWNGSTRSAVNLGDGVDWRHGAAVGAAGFLNGLLRQAGDVRLATQSMLVGSRWEISAIRLDQAGKHPHYNGQGSATTFYSRHHGDRVLEARTEGVPAVGQPFRLMGTGPLARVALLDVVATRSDRAVFVHGVNRSYDKDLEAEVILPSRRPAAGPATLHILEGVPEYQVAEKKAWMTERRRPVVVAGGAARVVFPKRSVSILEVGEE